jgi:hypothetical protein
MASSWVLSEEDRVRFADESGVLVSAPSLQAISSKIGEKRVVAELSRLSSGNSVERGFHVTGLANNCWRVDFFNFSSSLSSELDAKELHFVTVLVCFEAGFPISCGPTYRVVTPRLNFFSSCSQLLAGGIVQMEWKVAESMSVALNNLKGILCGCHLDDQGLLVFFFFFFLCFRSYFEQRLNRATLWKIGMLHCSDCRCCRLLVISKEICRFWKAQSCLRATRCFCHLRF